MVRGEQKVAIKSNISFTFHFPGQLQHLFIRIHFDTDFSHILHLLMIFSASSTTTLCSDDLCIYMIYWWCTLHRALTNIDDNDDSDDDGIQTRDMSGVIFVTGTPIA